MRQFQSFSPAQTQQIAYHLAKELQPGQIIAFEGGLGSGKTTFTRGLAKGLGLDETQVSSPTFSLVNEYRNKTTCLCHFDMYRIQTFDDLYSTGFFDYLEQGCILAIEWSENIAEFLPQNYITISFSGDCGTEQRTITIRGAQF